METIARTRRDHLGMGVSIKKVARDLKVAQNTVRKVVRNNETSAVYARKVQPRPKLGPWDGEPKPRLETNEKKPRGDHLSMIQIYEDLASLGQQPVQRGGPRRRPSSRRTHLCREVRHQLRRRNSCRVSGPAILLLPSCRPATSYASRVPRCPYIAVSPCPDFPGRKIRNSFSLNGFALDRRFSASASPIVAQPLELPVAQVHGYGMTDIGGQSAIWPLTGTQVL